MLQESDTNFSTAMSSNPASEVARSKKMLRIVLVDDHIVIRQGLACLLRGEQDINIVGQASNGESAVNLIREIQPDVVLMDISMPGMNGIQATRIIHSELPEVHIIGLSMFQEEEQSAAMREAGAVDYVSKSAPSEAVIAAIRACA
jgi:DNA-binding NarL/FixJ family response regulator